MDAGVRESRYVGNKTLKAAFNADRNKPYQPNAPGPAFVEKWRGTRASPAALSSKTVINGFTFDGTTIDPVQKAVRDSLIAFMAATAQAHG
jgi:hypothetical protein